MTPASSPSSAGREQAIDNELDLRGLLCSLWRGKLTVIACAVVFALGALIYSLVVRQEWTAIAITDKPTVNVLGSYFSQQQFLRNLDVKNTALPTTDTLSIADEAYQEFLRQLASYDTRRDFWFASPYYQSRKKGDVHADAVLLDELINAIQFLPHDDVKKLPDSARLVVETAPDANQLLRRYVDFANQRAANHLNEDVVAAWAARTVSLKAQVKRQEAVAAAVYHREQLQLNQALKLAHAQGIDRSRTNVVADSLPQSEMFLLGHPLLQARLDALQAAGPAYDTDYDQNRAMLTTLNVGPVLNKSFKTYRYLRTPEEPVKRDKPRRLFLLILWGAVGTLIGAGVALARRR
ncbi:Lipopolysaccharide biosynthesis protein WzzE [Sodalis glossinidius str. 'morsitans']|uniref:ECA polysaccharide chain length modulation protein n=1 Tax=Sodalis glossinidius (strain morsitans) TaxID=343509 RepID=Q2NQB6_SODGM|nr:ECA polysaccharide chain length modulation protein [Sodalis glossinidius]BAE75659.1 putative lipopolysaccharide biosynthesis protein [Sodalis glossinidius str. 'morsitans']CRL46751.1 Lipopolysaccharide biosynthesis protein WzzE [Sodalis glossinidius str. 'morsitans']